MCGIVGVWQREHWEDRAQATLQRMTAAISHRGPDDVGLEAVREHGLGLGFRRLAILDVSETGHQPMRSASGRFLIAFNGEIYNFGELKAELLGTGHRFRGRSDTEVILHCLEQWGVYATLPRLVGMFAMAVWDGDESLLYLTRDRLGEKPLYFGNAGGALVFASELKALRAHAAFDLAIDRTALMLFLRHGYVPAPYSIYAGTRKVHPGRILTFRGTVLCDEREYWSVREAARRGTDHPFEGSVEQAVQACDALLARSVGSQMVADVPLGAFLSGGVDSSLIVALMQAQSTRPVETFTIGFDDPTYNEAQHAKAVAGYLGTHHSELYVTSAEAMDVIPLLPGIYDEPFADPSQIPTYLVSRLARERVTVSLSGDGGDELFGGYNRYMWGNTLARWRSYMPRAVARTAASGIRALGPASWDRLHRSVRKVLPRSYRAAAVGDRLHKLAGLLEAGSREAVYRDLVSYWPDGTVLHVPETPRYALTDDASWPAVDSFIHRMMYLDSVSYLPDDILTKVDRASMSVSLESRAPFLDHRVVEFAWTLPLHHKVFGNRGKVILRRVLDRYVPRSLVERPKMGFGVPLDSWLRGPLRAWASELLSPERLAAGGYFNETVIVRRWAEHLSGHRNWQYALWPVLMFQAWRDGGSGAAHFQRN
jgi:asparagine synthase (glutamine-hydrolysing)